MRVQHTEVLVVGAGPVGMFTALLLAREGIQVQVIDQSETTAGHSYACGLHSRSLTLLRDAGLFDTLVDAGRCIERVGMYEGAERRGEISFADVTPEMPFMLVLPQDEFEEALDEALRKQEDINVLWNHRLANLDCREAVVHATVDELSGTATGYDVPRWETVVSRTYEITADIVIGCDGQQSTVKRAAGIEDTKSNGAELFVVYEFDSDFEMPNEMRIVLNPFETNVLWPMREGRYRWGFQWTDDPGDGEFPGKDRTHLWYEDKAIAQRTREHLESLLKKRAAWFTGNIGNIHWATDVQFQHRLAGEFGRKRLWLAGDAAHQTGPIGMQSMNVGLREAAALAVRVRKALRETGSLAPLDEYGEDFTAEWQRLLGVTSQLDRADPYIGPLLGFRSALLSCLPASGHELDTMLQALGFRLKTFAAPTAQRR